MDEDTIHFGGVTMIRLSSGQWVTLFPEELRENLHDWCGIETVEDDEDG